MCCGAGEYLRGQAVPCGFTGVRAMPCSRWPMRIGSESLGYGRERKREIGGGSRGSQLITDNAKLVARRAETEHGLDEILAIGAHHPCRANNRVARARCAHGSLAIGLAAAIDRRGIDRRVFAPWANAIGGKDIVG